GRYLPGASALQRTLLRRPWVASASMRLVTAPGLRRLVASTWSIYWNGLTDGAQPRPAAWAARALETTATRLAVLTRGGGPPEPPGGPRAPGFRRAPPAGGPRGGRPAGPPRGPHGPLTSSGRPAPGCPGGATRRNPPVAARPPDFVRSPCAGLARGGGDP